MGNAFIKQAVVRAMQIGGEMEMNDIEGLWLGICLVAFVVVATVTVLFAVTWEKIDLIYYLVKKKKLDGDNHEGQ